MWGTKGAGAAFAICAAILLPGPVSAQDPVKIGLLMTYSGQFSDPAAQMDNGIQLYMQQHGDTVAGKKIAITRKDSTGAPDTAKRLAQELVVREGAEVLAGFVITPEALAVAELSADAKKFMVVMKQLLRSSQRSRRT